MKTCTFQGCDKKHRAKGLCQQHYRQMQNGLPLHELVHYEKRGPHCYAQGCWHPVIAKGLCTAHYHRRRMGRLDWSAPLIRRRTGWVILRQAGMSNPFRVPKTLMRKLKLAASNRHIDLFDLVVDLLETHFKQLEYDRRMRRAEEIQDASWASRGHDLSDTVEHSVF
jgi:hypothetical protein